MSFRPLLDELVIDQRSRNNLYVDSPGLGQPRETLTAPQEYDTMSAKLSSVNTEKAVDPVW